MNIPPTHTPDPTVKVHVTAEFLPQQSAPAQDRYAFAYHIDIENHSQQPVQLISRHWLISDGNQHTEEVKGEGVVGQQPVISPGSHFRYSSGAVLRTPIGSMQGTYQMITADGTPFNAEIPMFQLICSQEVH